MVRRSLTLPCVAKLLAVIGALLIVRYAWQCDTKLSYRLAEPPARKHQDVANLEVRDDIALRYNLSGRRNVEKRDLLQPTPSLDHQLHSVVVKPLSTRSFLDGYTRHSEQALKPNDNGSFLQQTSIGDVFLAVKSTRDFHASRLELLLNTWIPFARQSIYIFTDYDDPVYMNKFESGHFKNTLCSRSHLRKDLVCKLSAAFDAYILSKRRWFCSLDDDSYLNVPNLVTLLRGYDHTKDWYLGKPSLKYPIRVTVRQKETVVFWFATGGAGYCISRSLALKMVPYALGGRIAVQSEEIKLPDDVTIGYIINHLLNVDLTKVPQFHSHLEGLWMIGVADLKDQITLSYGEFSSENSSTILNIINTGEIVPTLPALLDPTRLITVHCYLFPHARECAKFFS